MSQRNLEDTLSLLDQCHLKYTDPIREDESSDYEAHSFKLNSFSIRFRVAKITPTKIGQFVTLWKRIGRGPIKPFDASDAIDLVIIVVRKAGHFGQFIFPKSALIEFGIISTKNKEGKRAIRVYPPWDHPESKQAQRTQNWQLKFYLDIPSTDSIDIDRALALYSLT